MWCECVYSVRGTGEKGRKRNVLIKWQRASSEFNVYFFPLCETIKPAQHCVFCERWLRVFSCRRCSIDPSMHTHSHPHRSHIDSHLKYNEKLYRGTEHELTPYTNRFIYLRAQMMKKCNGVLLNRSEWQTQNTHTNTLHVCVFDWSGCTRM